MTYVALLRGINVGGKYTVDMKSLKSTFERVGMRNVSTYINSGNVIFRYGEPDADGARDARRLADTLEQAIETDFGFRPRVILRDADSVAALAAALPETWANDQDAKCDVMFLADDLDSTETVERLTIKPGIDDVIVVPGAVLWRVERANVTRSGMLKLVGTDMYRQMTVRNCNTLRRLAELVAAANQGS